MDFLLLVLASVIIYIRPSELVPSLASVPFFLIAIIPCLIASAGPLALQFSGEQLRHQPVSVLVIAIGLVATFVDLVNAQTESAFGFLSEFSKTILVYSLVVALLDRPQRLRVYLMTISFCYALTTIPTILNYHHIVDLPGCTIVGSDEGAPRMGGSNMVFGDPNDFAVNLAVAMLFGAYGLLDRRQGLVRVLWLVPLALCGYSIIMTQSRGGMLALLAGMFILFQARFGWRLTLGLCALAVPALFAVASGRQTDFSTSSGTSQSRIQLWIAGFEMLKESKLLGVGTGQFTTISGICIHNSFLQMFVETGLVGGIVFFAAAYFNLETILRLRPPKALITDPDLKQLRPHVVAATLSYMIGCLSLNFCFGMPTYVLLAIGTAYIRLACRDARLPGPVLTAQLMVRLALMGFLFLVGLYGFTRYAVRWS